MKVTRLIRSADPASLMNYFKITKSFDAVLEKVKILSIGDGKCKAEVQVEETHTNPMGGLHGGFSTTLVDVISAYALMTKVDPAIPHVSVDMNVRFLKGAKINDKIVIDANVIRSGKTLAFLDVEIKNKDTGDLLVKGSHTKYIYYAR